MESSGKEVIMKKIIALFMALFFTLMTGVMAEAADKETNRKLGYFDNTRTALLLPSVVRRGNSDEAAQYVNREMHQIFRYPYYRLVDWKGSPEMVSPADLPKLAEETGADIVVMPVVTEWHQWVFHRFLFDDGDDIIQTRAILDIYSYKTAEGMVRDDRGSYFNTEDEGLVRNVYILDDIMKEIYKTFPYRRVPKDVDAGLSEKKEAEKAISERRSL